MFFFHRFLLVFLFSSAFFLRAGDSDQVGLSEESSSYSLMASVGAAIIIASIPALRYSKWGRDLACWMRYCLYHARGKTIWDAIACRDVALVRYFSNENKKNFYYYCRGRDGTLLHAAVRTGDLEMVRVLLEGREHAFLILERAQKSRHRAIALAAILGHEDVVSFLSTKQRLLQYGSGKSWRVGMADATSSAKTVMLGQDGWDFWVHTALHHAAEQGHEKIIEILIGAGYPVNLPGKDKRTPLSCAVLNDRVGVIRLLVNHGAEIGACDLAYAAARNNAEVLRVLWDTRQDIDVDSDTSALRTALVNGSRAAAGFLASRDVVRPARQQLWGGAHEIIDEVMQARQKRRGMLRQLLVRDTDTRPLLSRDIASVVLSFV